MISSIGGCLNRPSSGSGLYVMISQQSQRRCRVRVCMVLFVFTRGLLSVVGKVILNNDMNLFSSSTSPLQVDHSQSRPQQCSKQNDLPQKPPRDSAACVVNSASLVWAPYQAGTADRAPRYAIPPNLGKEPLPEAKELIVSVPAGKAGKADSTNKKSIANATYFAPITSIGAWKVKKPCSHCKFATVDRCDTKLAADNLFPKTNGWFPPSTMQVQHFFVPADIVHTSTYSSARSSSQSSKKSGNAEVEDEDFHLFLLLDFLPRLLKDFAGGAAAEKIILHVPCALNSFSPKKMQSALEKVFSARGQSVLVVRSRYKERDGEWMKAEKMRELAGLDKYGTVFARQPGELFAWMRAHFYAAAGLIGGLGEEGGRRRGLGEDSSTPPSAEAEQLVPTHGIEIYNNNATPTLLSTLFFPVVQDNDVLIIQSSTASSRQAAKFDAEMQVVKDTLANLDGVIVTVAKINTREPNFLEQVSLVARSRVLIGLYYGAGLSHMLWGLPGRMKVGFFVDGG